MRNFEKNAEKITKAVEKFVEEQFMVLSEKDKVIMVLSEKDKVKKIRELLVGFQNTKKINGNFFVVLQLPEGVEGAIDSQGRLYDLNEI